MYEEIGGGADVISINGREISLRAYCSQFNFRGSDQQVALLAGHNFSGVILGPRIVVFSGKVDQSRFDQA